MLAHNFVVVVVVLLLIPPAHLRNLWMVPLGFFLVIGNLYWLALVLALVSTRFRDIPQLVANFVQVAFFLSPIVWTVDMLSPRTLFVAELNPLYHMMEIIRAPLLGRAIHASSWIFTGALFLVGTVFSLFVFARLRSRVPYWL